MALRRAECRNLMGTVRVDGHLLAENATETAESEGSVMSFLGKVTGSISYALKGEECRKDLKQGMSDQDLVKKYGEYTVSKVKKDAVK